jgi:2-dehydro-3-deoxy-D-arabinonate dehydratase
LLRQTSKLALRVPPRILRAVPSTTVYRSPSGIVAQRGEDFFRLRSARIDTLFTSDAPAQWLRDQIANGEPVAAPTAWLAPIENQEVWAAGVTYLRSRDARMEEAVEAGGGGSSFYDKVYDAERPELFFKATPHRVVGANGAVRIRSDARWNVPEPELALAVNQNGRIFGFTVGNDMSSRDIEGENPLYLPQAKVYRGCCALGPGIVVRDALPRETTIALTIVRGDAIAFSGETSLAQMKRGFDELVSFLFRDNDFPHGCFLLTGTGIIPPNEFSLASGDEIQIRIEHVGCLINRVA